MLESENYAVKLRLLEPMLGTIPKNKQLYTDFVASKIVDAGLREEEIETVPEIEERGWTGFHKDEKGHFVYDYFVKGFLCEAAGTIREWGKVKQLKSKFKKYCFVCPRQVRIPDPYDALERPLRASTPKGERITLVKSDMVAAGTVLEFNLEIIHGGGITRNCLMDVLSYGKYMGFGQWRSGGYGRFEVVAVSE